MIKQISSPSLWSKQKSFCHSFYYKRYSGRSRIINFISQIITIFQRILDLQEEKKNLAKGALGDVEEGESIGVGSSLRVRDLVQLFRNATNNGNNNSTQNASHNNIQPHV
jgi:hypothetical protein